MEIVPEPVNLAQHQGMGIQQTIQLSFFHKIRIVKNKVFHTFAKSVTS